MDKPSKKELRKLCFNKKDILEKLLSNMKLVISEDINIYCNTDNIEEKKRIVHKSVTLFAMLGMFQSSNNAKIYDESIHSLKVLKKKEFEESLLIAYNFLK